jgi:orotidine-5'-phosphate decarboxylase
MNFADKLTAKCLATKSVTCVGLDPRPEKINKLFGINKETPLEKIAAYYEEFCKNIISAVCEIVPAVKPNIAFFESLGVPGVAAYAKVCFFAREKGLLVIGDVKRGDIGSTAEAYAYGLLGNREGKDRLSNHDAITINAYLGSDGVKPFIERGSHMAQGMFLLVKTSNPSSAELQDMILKDGGTVAERMASLVSDWGKGCIGQGGFSSVGAVVGATHGDELAKFRKLMPRTPFLLPGYGAQGAGADDIVGAFLGGGKGGVVNASRSIIFAYEKVGSDDYAAAAQTAAEEMNADIKNALEKAGKGF